MTRGLVTVGPGVVGGRGFLRLLAAGREVRALAAGPARAAEVPGMLDAAGVQPGARVSLMAADPEHDARGLDAVAGSEFVDDRIRLRE